MATMCAHPSSRYLSDLVLKWQQDKPDHPRATADAQKALVHLQAFLRRRAVAADLTAATLTALATWLVARGFKHNIADRYCWELRRVAVRAVAAGALRIAPDFKSPYFKGGPAAFSIDELERIIAAAVDARGSLGGVPANRWWPAIIHASLVTKLSGRELLALPGDAFDAAAKMITAAGQSFILHPTSIDALARLGDRREAPMLFPWHNSRTSPYDRLCREFNQILAAAGVADCRRRTLSRLAATSDRDGAVIFDRLDVARIEAELHGQRQRRIAKELRDAAQRADAPTRRRPQRSDVVTLTNDGPRSLAVFLHGAYAKGRLIGCSKRTVHQYESTLRLLAAFRGCDVTLDQLSDDFVEQFLGFFIERGGTPVTANKHLATIQSLWRYAMKKRLLPFSFEPSMVEKLRVKKRCPSAWTVQEFQAIVDQAVALDGMHEGMPISRLLPAVMLTAYFTGARIGALVQLQTSAVNFQTGWLTIDADLAKHAMEQRYRLPNVCLAAIRATDPDGRAMLFACRPASRPTTVLTRCRRLRHWLKAAQKAAGLAVDSKSGFHRIRRLAATQMAKVAGRAQATELLGHSSPKLLAHYLDETQLGKPDAAELLPRITWQPPAA